MGNHEQEALFTWEVSYWKLHPRLDINVSRFEYCDLVWPKISQLLNYPIYRSDYPNHRHYKLPISWQLPWMRVKLEHILSSQF